jgi:carbonic anhydrase/acetyltransferase-like protein (isoleucine patch superfamily)
MSFDIQLVWVFGYVFGAERKPGETMERLFFYIGRSVREIGLALDRVGLRLQGNYGFMEDLSRHRRVMALLEQRPHLGQNTFIAPNATVVGDVKIGSTSSIWYGATLRGDVNSISIGCNTTVGDNAIIHVSGDKQRTGPSPTIIGNNVTIGNGAIIHGSTLKDNCSVEMGAIVFDRVVVEEKAIIGAGAVVLEGTVIPSGELWAGSPAKFVRKLTPEEQDSIRQSADNWRVLAQKHSLEHLKTSHERYVEDLERNYAPDPAPINPRAPLEGEPVASVRPIPQ